jgi:hypothetical protein
MGGKAFEGITQRIAKEDIPKTLDWLTRNWKDSSIQGGKYMNHLLGSAGKNPTSGDIDLNMRIELYDQEKVAQQLSALLGSQYVKARPGNNQIFTAVPINGDPKNGYVQVDFMFGNYEWQKFSYFSPEYDPEYTDGFYYWGQTSKKSCLKGLYRTELIKALVAFNSDWVLEENGEMVARVGPTFFHDKGCVWRYRHRPMRKDGNGRVKEFKELTKEEFLKIYPSATPARTDIIDDPKQVVEMVFDQHLPSKILDYMTSFETISVTMTSTYTIPERLKIYKIYVERLNNLKVEVPKAELKRFGVRL